jgi:LPXTG-motif cell wall-anchored protein
MRKLLKFTVLVLMIFPLLFVGETFAATDVSLSPSSGTVGYEFDVAVLVGTGSDEINGIALDVNYDGPVEFSSGVGGNLGCEPVVNGDTDEVVAITCFITPGDTFSGDGTLATLSFTASAAGTIDFTVTNIDIAGSSTGTASGASLTIDLDYEGGTGDTENEEEELPSTGIISDNILLIGGAVLFVLGVVVAFAPDTWNWMTFKMHQIKKRKKSYEEKIRSRAE